ncbi:MAG: energy-coupling factor transporter transmembrane protein EcfT [archaeon]|nr:energy-coupling factor transporter transmembrane protein EcfT [archaeon]MCP8315608.1 energy-coupling factor transporter transmembrane protein EcfT [archaeon]MCP8320720.1 energy-coupling factor transporter transmembrane protein EcfT [archaeon]
MFKYQAKDTKFHSLDPRSKFLWFSIIALLTLFLENVFVNILLIVIIFVTAKIAKVLKQAIKTTLFFIPAMFIVIFLNILLGATLIFGVVLALRLFIMISGFQVLLSTLHPSELIDALESFNLPNELSLSLSISFHFMPIVIDDIRNIYDAQRTRGLEIEGIRKIKAILPLIIPLIVISLRRAMDLAEALESKAYGSAKRTSLGRLEFKKSDYVFISLCFLILVIALIVSFR